MICTVINTTKLFIVSKTILYPQLMIQLINCVLFSYNIHQIKVQ